VITDHAMPGMRGTELATQISHLWPGSPVALVTGYADLVDDAARGLPRLLKPYRQEELASLIAGLASDRSRSAGALAGKEPTAWREDSAASDGNTRQRVN